MRVNEGGKTAEQQRRKKGVDCSVKERLMKEDKVKVMEVEGRGTITEYLNYIRILGARMI